MSLDFDKKPSPWQVFTHHTLASPLYKGYIKRLGLKGDERMLDFGSGMGSEAKHIAKILKGGNGHLTCVDVSKAWTEVAKKKLKKFSNIDFQLGEIDNLPIQDNSYDAIVMHFVLHHIDKEQKEEKLKTLASKLKLNGKIFIREPMRESHGLPIPAIRDLMQKVGLVESSFKMTKSILGGMKMYEGVYQKKI